MSRWSIESRPVKCLPVLHCWLVEERLREGYGYRVEIGLWSSEIAVIWRQAGRQTVVVRLHLSIVCCCCCCSFMCLLRGFWTKRQQRSRTRMDGNLWAGNDDKKMWTCTTKWIHNASWKQRQGTTDRWILEIELDHQFQSGSLGVNARNV